MYTVFVPGMQIKVIYSADLLLSLFRGIEISAVIDVSILSIFWAFNPDQRRMEATFGIDVRQFHYDVILKTCPHIITTQLKPDHYNQRRDGS